MTATELRAAIESACTDSQEAAALWAHVFEAPKESEPDPGEMPTLDAKALEAWRNENARRSVWRVKTNRAGQLHPDAAFDLAKWLRAHGVVEATPDLVAEAKNLAGETR